MKKKTKLVSEIFIRDIEKKIKKQEVSFIRGVTRGGMSYLPLGKLKNIYLTQKGKK